MEQFNKDTFKKNLPVIPFVSSKGIEYSNVAFGFDTETTSTIIKNDTKFAFIYEWTFGYFYHYKYHIVYGRKIEEFFELLDILQYRYNLNEKRRLVIYIHNFAFEFQFIRKYIEWKSVFATNDRYPIKAVSKQGIEFRDSLILSALSLEKTADNLQKYKVQKMSGDLDYSLVRNSKTKLSKKELKYCENDVKVICAYITEQIEEYGKITKIPLTNTGRVRELTKNNCYFMNKKHSSKTSKYKRYSDMIHNLTLDTTTYDIVHHCFQGGFTHANSWYVGKLLHNVHSIDFTSSYPAVMLTEKFPMSSPIKFNAETTEELYEKLKQGYGCMVIIRFYEIEKNIMQESYISKSKCIELENFNEFNGRIIDADLLTICCTEIDLKIIQKCYKFKSYDIVKNYTYLFYMDYLPKDIIETILNLYKGKTTLKGVKGKEAEYLKSKGMLNSVYGMSVTNIIHDEIIYNDNDEWEKEKPNKEKQIEKYNNQKMRFLYYPWGVWVTAYARRNLWEGIFAMGNDYVYSDTDSIKFLHLEKHKKFIENYNKNIEKKLKKMCSFYHLDFNLCKPKTIKGKEKLIGVWDYEGFYDYFKTLGAKRYLVYKDGNFTLTCAGLPKQKGCDYITHNKTVKQAFDSFTNDLYVPADDTGKTSVTYIDETLESDITDYQGNTEHVISLSGAYIFNCDFTLSMSRNVLDFLSNFKNGYISKEVQY